MTKYAFGFLLVLVFFGGCGPKKPQFTEEELAKIPLAQRKNLPKASGGFVLAVNGETITSNQVILPILDELKSFARISTLDQFKKEVGPEIEQIVNGKISDILLYKQAKKQAGDNIDEALEKAVDSEVRRYIISFEGDSAKAEQTLKNRGFDWVSFREFQKKIILTQSYISQKMPEKKPIPHSEMLEYYDRIKDKNYTTPSKLVFRLIDIQPERVNIIGPTIKTKQQQAKELAQALFVKLKNGEDFAELATQYSHHKAASGGLWKPVHPDALAEPYDILARRAENMQPGQFTEPIETDGHFFIMKLEEKIAHSVAPFEEVQKEIEAEIYLERNRKALEEFENKLVAQASVENKYEFVNFCLEEIYRLSGY